MQFFPTIELTPDIGQIKVFSLTPCEDEDTSCDYPPEAEKPFSKLTEIETYICDDGKLEQNLGERYPIQKDLDFVKNLTQCFDHSSLYLKGIGGFVRQGLVAISFERCQDNGSNNCADEATFEEAMKEF